MAQVSLREAENCAIVGLYLCGGCHRHLPNFTFQGRKKDFLVQLSAAFLKENYLREGVRTAPSLV
jgi:hypothetical protein